MEKDDEVKGSGNNYDFGARMYDNRVGRWLSIDAHSSKYPSFSPYSYVNNTPLSAIDPDGKDVIILIWYPEGKDQQGHTAIAVENYKQKADELGNLMFEDVMGADNILVKTPIMEKDGTYTYYDFWPATNVPKNAYMSEVTGDPNKKQVASLDLLMNTDQSPSGEQGQISYGGEGKAPEAVYRISTTMEQDMKIGKRADILQKKKYNAQSFNCTTFAVESLRGGFDNNTINKNFEGETIHVPDGGALYGYPENVISNTPSDLCRDLFSLQRRGETGKLKEGEPTVTSEKSSANGCQTEPYMKLIGQ
jgi:RHS repeat-associated protein